MSEQPNEKATYKHDPEAAAKLKKLAKDINIAMLTTTDAEGALHSRPMATNGEVEFDGTIWFFTYASSGKAHEVEANPRVNVSFSDTRTQTYVSFSGTARIVRDKAKIKELYKPVLNAWFPKGTEEPDIALLEVTAEKAEFWDSPSGFIATTVGLIKSAATGTPPGQMGDHEKVALS